MITITVTIQQRKNDQGIELVDITAQGKGDNPTPREARVGNFLTELLRTGGKKVAEGSGGFVVADSEKQGGN